MLVLDVEDDELVVGVIEELDELILDDVELVVDPEVLDAEDEELVVEVAEELVLDDVTLRMKSCSWKSQKSLMS